MDEMNIILLVILGASLLLFFDLWKKQREMKRLTTIDNQEMKLEKKKSKKLLSNEFFYFESLKRRINLYFQFKKNKEKAKVYFYGILIIELVIFVAFILWNKPIFAIAFPLTLHVSAIKALDLLSLSIHHYLQKEMPYAIKHLIKVMSKTSDLKTIMYETSTNLNQPLRGLFFDISRKMISDKPEKVLEEFAEEIDNIWFYAFTFLMISYKEQSKKSDIITNLTTLADMLDKEMYLREKAITDKKFVTIMNYALAFIGAVLFAVNMIFNFEHAYPFFFENLTGMVALLFGIWAIIGTIIVNLMMTSQVD